jgi:hypothetical protein
LKLIVLLVGEVFEKKKKTLGKKKNKIATMEHVYTLHNAYRYDVIFNYK